MMTTQITTALITGASSGIGAVYADRLAARAMAWPSLYWWPISAMKPGSAPWKMNCVTIPPSIRW